MTDPRTVFFVSDRTGITAEMLGNSLLSQFEDFKFQRVTMPFVDTPEKLRTNRDALEAKRRQITSPLTARTKD